MATRVDAMAHASTAVDAVDASDSSTKPVFAAWRADQTVVWGVVALWAIAITLLTVLHLDIAASRYVQNDLLFRGAESIDSFYRQPVMDPSPHSIAWPADLFVQRALTQGTLPTWDRSQGGGYSPLAQGNLGMLFPMRWFAALFPAGQVQSVVLLSSLAACWVFSFLGMRRLELGVQAACLGAMVYSLSGFMIGQLLFDGVAVYLFLPWLVFAYLGYCANPDARRMAHLAVAFGLSFTSGHLMLLSCVFVGVATFAFLHAFHHRGPFTDKLRQWGALATASGWGALLASPFLIPWFLHFRSAWKYKTQTAEGVSYEVPDLAGWLARLRAMTFDDAGPFMDGPGFYLYLGLPVLLLAGIGVAACWRSPERRFIATLLIAMFAVGVPGPWMAFAAAVPPITFIRTFYLYAPFVFAVALASAAGLDWVRRHPSLPAARAVGLGIVVSMGLMLAARGSEHFRPIEARPIPESRPVAFLEADRDLYRVTGLWGQLHLPNIAHVTGIEDLRLLAVTMNPRYHAWFEIVDPAILGKNFPTARITEQLSSPLVGAFNVKYVLEGKLPHHYFVTQLEPGDPFGAFDPRATRLSSVHLTPRYEDGLLRIHEVTETYKPRAYFASRAAPVEPGVASASQWLRAHPERHGDTVVVEVSDPVLAAKLAALDPATESAPIRSVQVRYPSDARVSLRVRTEAAGLLVLNDLFEAGWVAEVDGVPREILATNLISRGLWLEAGDQNVVMRYSPPGLHAGFAMSGLALIALGLWVWRQRGVRSAGPEAMPDAVSRPQLRA